MLPSSGTPVTGGSTHSLPTDSTVTNLTSPPLTGASTFPPLSTATSPTSSTSVATAATRAPTTTPTTGTIAGAGVGGFIFISLVVFLVWRFKRKKEGTTGVMYNSIAHPIPAPQQYAFEPYTLLRPSTTPAQVSSKHIGTEKFAKARTPPPNRLSVTDSPRADAERSRDQSRVQQLRSQRDRINRELASLEHGSITSSESVEGRVYAGQRTVSLRTVQWLLSEQLSGLQTQITQLEERWQHGQSDLPPLYETGFTRAHQAGKEFPIFNVRSAFFTTDPMCKNNTHKSKSM